MLLVKIKNRMNTLNQTGRQRMEQKALITEVNKYIEALNKLDRYHSFSFSKGRNWIKVFMHDNFGNVTPNKTIHSFIDINNGNIYKPASFNRPYQAGKNAVRYNLVDDWEELIEKIDPYGHYLYLQ